MVVKVPANLELPYVEQEFWVTNSELLTLYQPYPDNPFWVVRPYYANARVVRDVQTPQDLDPYLGLQEALRAPIRWLRQNMSSPVRNRMAYRYSVDPYLNQAGRERASGTVTHITKLYESIQWPKNIGVIFPDSVPIILRQCKRIWTVEPLKIRLPSNWRRYDMPTYIEYARIK